MEERKGPAMRNQRTFNLEFKRQVIEELLSGESCGNLCNKTSAFSQLCWFMQLEIWR
jgi:hypothetical protein